MPYTSDEIPFEPGSDTSEMAARMVSNRAKVERAILDALRIAYTSPRFGPGLTDDQLEQVTKGLHQTVSASRRGLVLKGLVKDSGKRRATRTGRPAVVWIATQQVITPPPDGGTL